jgi:hypothetical protein
MNDLYINAVYSLQLGVEDFKSNDARRWISSARNYYAGLLLLAKQCLLEQAPKADPLDIIASRFQPVLDGRGGVSHQPKGHGTVDLDELKSRFEAFNIPWSKSWNNKLKKLQVSRNNLEHFHPKEPLASIRETIAATFSMVDDMFKILRKEPAVELGAAWQLMLDEKHFFEEQREACKNSFVKIKWFGKLECFDDIQCPHCGSGLIEQRDFANPDPQRIEGRCRACGSNLDAEEMMKLIIDNEFWGEAHISAKDGGDEVISLCPECGEDTYVTSDLGINECLWCEFKLEGECARCHETLTPSNVSENLGLCGYCHNLFLRD